jgi:hypothetical protein
MCLAALPAEVDAPSEAGNSRAVNLHRKLFDPPGARAWLFQGPKVWKNQEAKRGRFAYGSRKKNWLMAIDHLGK